MSRNFVMRAAVGLAVMMCAVVVLESQADACFKRFRNKGCCESSCEPSCGCPAEEEPSCGCPAVEEPACGKPAEEPSCGCPAPEPSCGCPAEPSCGCDSGCGRKHRLFGRRNKGCGGCCESSCEPSCGAPSDSEPAEMEAPPAPEAPST